MSFWPSLIFKVLIVVFEMFNFSLRDVIRGKRPGHDSKVKVSL
jgi:hypothetical protein